MFREVSEDQEKNGHQGDKDGIDQAFFDNDVYIHEFVFNNRITDGKSIKSNKNTKVWVEWDLKDGYKAGMATNKSNQHAQYQVFHL